MSYAFRKILNHSQILNQSGSQNTESIAKYGKYGIESPLGSVHVEGLD